MKTRRDLSRRDLLRTAAVGLGVVAGLSACKKAPPLPLVCANAGGLLPEDVLTRKTLGYTDAATDPKKTCANCQQYVPASADDQCGGCKIMKGQIHPAGYCKAYALRA